MRASQRRSGAWAAAVPEDSEEALVADNRALEVAKNPAVDHQHAKDAKLVLGIEAIMAT